MKVLTLLNEKGGVGKTTLAVHIAQGLACKGLRVMLIDGDPQGHSTIRCGKKKAPGLYDLLVREENWRTVLYRIKIDTFAPPGTLDEAHGLWLLPSNVETRNIANSISDAEQFALRLGEMAEFVDVVVIDTSPTPSLLHGAFYTATDAIIYPTMLTFTSFDGLVESIQRRQAANKARALRWGLPEIAIGGIVPVAYRSETLEQQANLKSLFGQFGALVWQPIHQATLWTETEGSAKPVWLLAGEKERAVQEAWATVERARALVNLTPQPPLRIREGEQA